MFKNFGNSAAFSSATTSSELLNAPARDRLGEPIECLNLIGWCIVWEKCLILACRTSITDGSEGKSKEMERFVALNDDLH